MRATRRGAARGFLLAYVLVVSAILSVVAMLLLESAQSAAIDARQIEVKNESFDAAEAGLNAALEALDSSLGLSTSRSATLANGYRYTYYIHPNFTGAAPVSIDDPGEGAEGGQKHGGPGLGNGNGNGHDQVAIPAGGAVIVCVGTGPNGERPSTLEAAVTADVAQLTYPRFAIVSGLNIQGTYTAKFTSLSYGGNDAVLHANGTITARAGQGFQATAEASGTTNTLPPGTTRATQVSLPVVSQFDYMIANYRNQVSTYGGSTNVLVPGGASLQATYACPLVSQGQGCLLFYDGPLTITSAQTAFSGRWTMVINGNFTATGGALAFRDRPSLLVVNGNAKISGIASTTAYLQVKGTTSVAGAATFVGAIMTLGTLTFDGGSGGAFSYDPSVIPPGRSMVGLVKIISYAEY